ncbi:MAG: S9 family peptidase [Propionibacteriaceae bacterium]|nr:S9 family peptidase [Propionibacteriaceae bacterium]
MRTLRYGSWPSPIAPADLAASGVRLSPGLVDGGIGYWAEGRPSDGGRVSLWRRLPGADPAEVAPGAYVRSAVNEYGGGAWTARDGLVAYCSWPDGAVHLVEDGLDRVLAAADGLRYAGLSLVPARRLLLAVREDHRASEAEPEQTVVALELDAANSDGGRVLAAGADFYAHPGLSADDRLAWCEWDHPNMPWDSTRVVTAPLADPGARTVVAGGDGLSVLYPAWDADGGLVYLSDASGFWNFHRWTPAGDRLLYEAPHEFCGPLWVHDPVPYALVGSGLIGCSWLVDGIAKVGVLRFDPDATGPGELVEFSTAVVAAEVTGRGPVSLALFGYADRPDELVELDWRTGGVTPLRASAELDLDPAGVSAATGVTWDGPDGAVHAWYYPPSSASCQAPAGELPPVQVWIHGGPTSYSAPEFSVAVQFWTSRGIGILDVNYSGSTGYGRAYRNRLRGSWGVADVRDCVQGALALADAGLADRGRLSIRGGSAGGYTTLAALTTSEVFAAGISLYGIGDLETLATDTHKFESRYLDGLVAPYPAQRQVYVDRSPIHHLDRLSCPMLILQGLDDKVVPPDQATTMADAVRAKGLPVRLRLFAGEGHGFRKAETIVAVAEEALAFLGDVHRFVPAGR